LLWRRADQETPEGPDADSDCPAEVAETGEEKSEVRIPPAAKVHLTFCAICVREVRRLVQVDGEDDEEPEQETKAPQASQVFPNAAANTRPRRNAPNQSNNPNIARSIGAMCQSLDRAVL
jgi:hypothetical protein